MPKPEPRPLRTLPERAFHARAQLVAALMCCVCFAGLAARLAYLQLFSGDWYTSRALGQQLRDTVVPADRGRIYSDDGVLLAAAPTTIPCIRHWRRSLLLPLVGEPLA